ncbi:hypothetical protein JCM11251_003564 [Rhodosporidiobolus azoricus]
MDPSALDPSLSGAIDPALSGESSSAIDPSLSGMLDPSLSAANTTSTTSRAVDPTLDPSLFPAGLSHDPATAAAYEVALGMQDDQPVAVAENDTPEERLKKLRTDYRAAAVSHWATLFLHHAGEEFDVEAFEKDLISTGPDADDQFLPHFLGRILNTLANDRNTNHTNWLNALRRSYNRRVSTRDQNPFYTWVRVPASVVEAEKEAEREREEKEWEEKYGAEEAGDGKVKWEGEEERLREAERALGRKNRPKTEDDDLAADNNNTKPPVVHEAGAADVNMAVPSAEAAVPVTEEALDDGFNAELADVIGGEGVKDEVKGEGEGEGEGEEVEDEWYEEQRAVEWGSLGLETKLDAIYNVCEWHMVDPERQFRKYLQWDGEAAWRLDPLGSDSEGNKYYHLADDRLWIQRTPPQPNPYQPEGEDTPAGQVAGKKPKTLLGLRAGPRDKSKKGTVTGTVRVKLKRDKASGRYLQVDEDDESPAVGNVDLSAEGDEEEGAAGEGAKRQTIEEDVEMPIWEKEYWEERARAENTPGFVEWEALCITMDDWRAFPARFATSTDPDERELVRKIEEEVIPGIEEDQARREEEAAARAAKRAALLASQETAAEEEARITAERLAHAERFSRSTRGVRTNYSEDSFGVAAAQHGASAGSAAMAAGGSNTGSGSAPPQESREERLKKREEEKRRAEEEEAARVAQEQWEAQREEARAANGGVLPVEFMNEEEREEYERAQEKERKKREQDERKRASEEKKKARAKERRAELKAERDAIAREEAEAEEAAAAQAAAAAARAHAQAQAQAAALAAVPPEAAAADDPWWMDCEGCGLCGWNVDDGQELICCDECEEWQHTPCHVLLDQQAGRPPQPFHDEDYKWACGRCQGYVPRTQRPPLPNPPNAQLPCISAITMAAQQAGGKRRASDQNGRAAKGAKMPAAKKPKVAKANGAQQASIPYGHGAHPLYHPSAYSHPAAAAGVAVPAPVAPSPPPQQQAAPSEPMSYEQLKAMVENNPALLSQLPAEYQQHFSQLLGIPLS